MHQIAYADWLLKFCVSVSWRLLTFAKERGSNEIFGADEALRNWLQFLRGERSNPGTYEQHCIPFGTVGTDNPSRLPANINRYLLRAIAMDIVQHEDFIFTYAKIGPVAILGFIELKTPKDWPDSKVHVRNGIIGKSTYHFPVQLWKYWERKAEEYGGIPGAMSERQQTIANQTSKQGIEKNRERLANSHWLKAMQQDAELFGDRAFREGWPNDSDSSGL